MSQPSSLPPPVRMPRPLPGFEHINRYWDQTRGMLAAKILPGEFYVTDQEELITTVLGSCVSACIRDRITGLGGMNHFMLPHDATGKGVWRGADAVSESTRYGSYAMERLVNEILKRGGSRKHMEVKVFGGGKVLANATDVGSRNVRFVRHYLQMEGFTITAEDLGDLYPRKVVYFPKSGKVLVKKLMALQNDTLFRREEAYMHEIEGRPVQGEIDLF